MTESMNEFQIGDYVRIKDRSSRWDTLVGDIVQRLAFSGWFMVKIAGTEVFVEVHFLNLEKL